MQTSDQSELFGLSVAVIGFPNYIAIAVGLTLRAELARAAATALAVVVVAGYLREGSEPR